MHGMHTHRYFFITMTSTELEELLRSSSSEKIKQNKQNSAEELNMDLKV